MIDHEKSDKDINYTIQSAPTGNFGKEKHDDSIIENVVHHDEHESVIDVPDSHEVEEHT